MDLRQTSQIHPNTVYCIMYMRVSSWHYRLHYQSCSNYITSPALSILLAPAPVLATSMGMLVFKTSMPKSHFLKLRFRVAQTRKKSLVTILSQTLSFAKRIMRMIENDQRAPHQCHHKNYKMAPPKLATRMGWFSPFAIFEVDHSAANQVYF